MKKTTHSLTGFLIIVTLFTGKMNAQLSGAYTIPGSYVSIAAAITDLNTFGVSGPVTINIAASYIETAPVGGYTLNAIVGASSVNQITFQKSGVGANPLISAYAGGLGVPTSTIQDGIWRFAGTDWVTINGIDLTDPNTTNPSTMEFGYGFFKASALDGCQNNTIRNCVITLNRVNNAAGAGPAIDGSRGIDMVSAAVSNHTVIVTVTAATGANSNNKFYSNTIQNCNYGISLIGYAAASPFTNADTGNDIGGASSSTGNTIVNFGGGGTTSAASGIRTLAQYSINIGYNIINNNNGAGVNHARVLRGIYLNTAISTNATVNSNTITLNGGGTSQQVTPIENASGSTAAGNIITITNNLIINCTYSTATSGVFYGIYNNSTTPASLTISGNILSNNSTNATSGSYFNIYNSGNVTSVITISNNIVGLGTFSATSTSLELAGIYNTGGAATATLSILSNTLQNCNYVGTTGGTGQNEMIYNSSTGAVVNFIGNIFNNVLLKTTNTIYIIYDNTSTPITNTNNNSITTGFANTGAGGGALYGYYNYGSPGSGTASFTGNNFSNISMVGAGSFYGMYQATSVSQVEIFTNNLISNVTASTSTAYGLYHNYGAVGSAVTGNTVTNLVGANVFGIQLGSSVASNGLSISGNVVGSCTAVATAGQALGIYHTLGTATNIFKNKISDIVTLGATGVVGGLYIGSGGTLNIYNNLIGDLKAPGTGGICISGLYFAAGTTINAYYNTVNLSGTSSGSNFGSVAIYAATAPAVTLRNNIFVNNCVPTGAGVIFAYYRGSTTLGSYSTNSNNNLFYAGTPSASNLIFYDGTNSSQTLAAYKTFVSTRDAASITENPTFASTSGSNANFLNINTVTPTQIESGGTQVAGITDDYAGTIRNVSTPDIGAWEGNFVLNDIVPPSLTGSNFTTPGCVLSGRTFTASFSDASGVATGLLAPRIYYKINAGAYTSVSGVLSSGTFSNGVWTFNMAYSASLNDVISYFVVAQDAFATPNLMAFPSAGFSGTDVNTISTNPTTPNFYIVNSLNGIYTVGSAGTFTSLTAASLAYNAYCITGPVTFSLTDALYSTAEVFPIVFRNNAQASVTNSLLIIPASGVSVVITPTVSALSSIIKFLDARYITLDGLNTSGSSLNINNSVASAAVANVWFASSNAGGSGNNFISVKNTAINGISNTSSNGFISSIDGANPSTTGGVDNDNITISTNTILTVFNGILATGSSSVSAGGMDNWTVANNIFGKAVTTSTAIINGNPIYMNNGLGFSITSNTIQNVSTIYNAAVLLLSASNFSATGNTIQSFTTATNSGGAVFVSAGVNFVLNNNIIQNGISSISGGGLIVVGSTNFSITANAVSNLTTNASSYYGMNINSNNTGFAIAQNTITNLYSSASSSGVNAIAAIYLGSAVINGTINLNTIYTIVNNYTSGYGVKGIIVNTGALSNITIRNNFISDIYCYVDQNIIYWPAGIDIEGTSGGINVYYNSINLFGSHTGYASAAAGTGAAPILVAGTSGNLNITNNLLSNTYDNSTQTTDVAYAIYSAVSATNFTSIDYNNYYVGGTGNNPYLGYLGSNQATLYGLQNVFGFGQNLHSLNFQPQFTSTTDLHLLASSVSNAGINNAGVPISGITVDIDGQTRSLTTPDIGADEFTATGTCTSAVGGTMPVTSATLCTTQTVLATPSGISSGLGTSYQWKVGSTTGGPYGNITTGTGTSSPTYFSIASGFAPGIYYVVFQASCASPLLTGISNEATVTIVAPPTVNIASTSSLICQGNSATLTASGTSTSYVWNTSATTSSISISPAAATPYTVTGSNGVCSTSNTINILYSINPTVNVVSASPTVCSNVSATLTASGATTYSWSNGSTAAVINPTQTGATGYTVNGYNASGCISLPVSTTVSVNQSPTVTISGSSGLCTGQTATLTASGAASYLWSTSSTATTITNSPTTNTVYFVTGTNSLACSSTTSQSVSVAASLSISISGATAVCSGKSATLTATGGVTYLWYDGSITTTIAPTPTANTTYSVIGSSGTCSNTAAFTVTMNPNPVVSIAGNATVCSGSPRTFTASGASTYSWTSGVNTSTATVAPTTNTSYIVTGTSSLACSSGATVVVTTNTLPVISVAQTATGVCLTSSTTFTAGGASTYTWTGGPVNTFYTVTPTASTVYTVTGTNPAGCISSKTVGVTSYTLPVFSIVPASATVCSLSQVNFVASGANTYTWSGTSTPGASVSYTPVASIVYTVTGTSTQSCVSSTTVGVTTNSLPIVAITPPSATVCSQSGASFVASGASTYNWNNTFFTANFSAAPINSSTYSVTGTSSQGCSTTATVGVMALALPTVVVSPAISTVCVNSTGIYTVSGGLTYTWSSNSSNATTIAITPTATSAYPVSGTDINGCISSGQAVIITNPLPVITISPLTATVCPNTAVNFTASGANTYSWSTGIPTASAVITPSVSGIYTVTGIDANSCAGTQTLALTTKTVPVITISPASSSVCLNASASFSASGAVSYTWSNNTAGTGINVSPSVTTVYTVTGKNGIGCISTATANLNIWQPPVINIATNATTVCAKELITLIASGASTYTWYPFNVTGATFTNNPTNTIPYSVIATDANGCTNSDTLIVYVDKCTGIKQNTRVDTQVSIYPNPSSGIITANFGFEGSKEILVLNSVGALVMKAFTEELSTTIDLSGYAKGVYFVRVHANGDSANYKIIIQ